MAIFAEVVREIKNIGGSYYSIIGEVKNKSVPVTIYLYGRSNGNLVGGTITYNGNIYTIGGTAGTLNLMDDFFVVGIDPNKIVNGTVADLPTVTLYRTPVYEY